MILRRGTTLFDTALTIFAPRRMIARRARSRARP